MRNKKFWKATGIGFLIWFAISATGFYLGARYEERRGTEVLVLCVDTLERSAQQTDNLLELVDDLLEFYAR